MKYLLRLLLVAVYAMIAGIWFFVDDEPDGTTVEVPPKPPASSGIYVQDYAGVISAPVRSYLQNLGRQLDQKTTAQLTVVTVKSLNGAPLEEYSLKLLRDWGIGNKEKNNGVLILVSTGDRKSRVEVGYGLEGALTDSITGLIQDQYMIPYFRKGTYEEGIARGYEALALRIAKEYNVQLAVSGYNNHSPGTVKAGADGQSTEALFEKALKEQNGTESMTGNTVTGTEENRSDVAKSGKNNAGPKSGPEEIQGSDLRNHVANGGEPAPSGTGSTLLAGVLSVFGFLMLKGEWLVDTVGWVPVIVALLLIDFILLNGAITSLLLRILGFFFSGGGGSGGSSGGGGYSGGFGGGSGGGGGSSRSW
jgi:uncharacterized membrane protein YgcG